MTDRLLDRLKADFKSKCQVVRLLDMDVFVSPLTITENTKVMAMYPGDSAKRQATFIIMKCKDEAGKPLFADEDREALIEEVSGNVFDNVFAVMNGRTVEDQVKN